VPETDVALGAEEREMLRRVLVWATMVAALMVVPAVAAAATGAAKSPAKPGPTPRYYVALGDSLSQGMQPDAKGLTVDTDDGYVDDIGAWALKRIPTLQVIKLGCGGDTTTSLLTGKGNDAAAKALHCDRQGGSQLAAAVSFLKSHHAAGEVPLITIDIGANDVDGCVTATNLSACLAAGLNTIKVNTPKILNTLRKAAPKGTKLIAMNLYDPVLGGYFAPSTDPLHALALASPALTETVNATIDTASKAAGFKVADVGTAFHTTDTTPVTWEGQTIPADVAYVCSWTWACQTPPSGPNIHANRNGYQVIANTFERVIGKL
jgi:lysophospholipase L1-like esterase